MNYRHCISILVALSAGSGLVGCKGMPEMRYPETWPSIDSGGKQDCSSISGRFAASAAQSTHTDPPAGYDLRLDELLRTGYATTARSNVRQSLRVARGRFLVDAGGSQSQATAIECGQGREVKYLFKGKVAGESFTDGRRSIELVLHMAVDGSLIVRQVIETCGLHAVVVPGCHQLSDWYRFQNLGDESR